MEEYTRREVTRILGITERQLSYWERLDLVRPQARCGELLYSFGDLISLRTIQQLAQNRVPARRLRRALSALERQIGPLTTPLSSLRAFRQGRDVVMIPPAPYDRAIAPLSGQFVFHFGESVMAAAKVCAIATRSPEEWFEAGLALENDPESLPAALEAYRQALALSPDWTDAWLNLGAVLYQVENLEQATQAFRNALRIEPENPRVHMHLGSVLCERGGIQEAIEHLRMAIHLDPQCADAHLNLALAYEKQGDHPAAQHQWPLYLRVEPEGPWADYARSRLGCPRSLHGPSKTIPFRRL